MNRTKNNKRNNNIARKKLSKKKFNNKYGLTFQQKYLQNKPEINLVIMYDLDAPFGKNSTKKNQNLKYIHYFMLNNKILVPYAPPTPPEGEHRYIIKNFTIGKEKMEKLLKKLSTKNLQNRKNIQNISKFNILGINLEKELKNRKVFYVRK